ncbi:MAG: type II toxin-antitoxin system RelE/ParE family toxin [Alphaproteobacteria bacterium]|nr:type II toxin-antitoxin system RelE/ParE family toxin [Alphaproteobacteria bacterium]
MRFRFSRQAEIDIEEIGDFIARDNPARAVTYIQQLRTRCVQLTGFPEAAPTRSAYGDGVRMVVFGRYLILYVTHEDLLESAASCMARAISRTTIRSDRRACAFGQLSRDVSAASPASQS